MVDTNYNFLKVIVLLLFFNSSFVSTHNLFGQNCSSFHETNCTIPDFTFFYNQQSKSFSLFIGEKMKMDIVAYEGTDYFLSVCSYWKLTKIQMKIYDGETKELIYDNAKEEYIDNIVIRNKNTRKLIIEVSIPAEHNDVKKNDKKFCVGVLIATRMRNM